MDADARGKLIETPAGAILLSSASVDDFERLRGIHRAAMRPIVEKAVGWDDEQQHQRLKRHFDPEHLMFLELNGETVGCVCHRHEGTHWFIEQFYLMPARQGHGIGRAILDYFLAIADVEGWPTTLKVLKNSRAKALYERSGFVDSGGDQWQDYMARTQAKGHVS